jgi:hypothetical protein
MAFSVLSSSFGLKTVKLSTPADVTVITSPAPTTYTTNTSLKITSILSAQTSISCSNISSDGSSIVIVNNAKNVFVSTNYGVSFTQKTDTPIDTLSCSSCISNGGQYILITYNNNTTQPLFSNNYGATWNTIVIPGIPTLTTMYMSCTGQYMSAEGSGHISINNNYGNSSNWTIHDPMTSFRFGSMSSSGQYILYINFTATQRICYSTDYGVTFTLDKAIATNANGLNTYVSSTGQFNFILSSSGGANNVLYSTSSANTSSGTFSQTASTGIRAMLISNTGKHGLCSNEDGSKIYYSNGVTTTGGIYVSSDKFGAHVAYYKFATNNFSVQTYGSDTTKYMLIHDVTNNSIQLINNTALSV